MKLEETLLRTGVYAMQGEGKAIVLQIAYHHESVVMLWDELLTAVQDMPCVKVRYSAQHLVSMTCIAHLCLCIAFSNPYCLGPDI